MTHAPVLENGHQSVRFRRNGPSAPITAAALGTLPAEWVGGGSGLFNVFRNMGGAVGLALINDHWDGRYDRHYWWLVERLTPAQEQVGELLDQLGRHAAGLAAGLGPSDQAAVRTLARMVAREAQVMAWNDVFLMLAVLFAGALVLLLLLKRPEHTDIAAH